MRLHLRYSRILTRYEISTKVINAKEINATDELCLKFLNEVNVVQIIDFKMYENKKNLRHWLIL